VSDAIDRPPERLGARLKLAREGADLGLSELARKTHVRRAYLEALEEGRYAELPEDVYARNFVRLYAQALDLEPAPLLELYQHERRAAVGTTTLELQLDRDRRLANDTAGPAPAARRRAPALPAWLFGPWPTTLVLVAVVVGLAVWGFDRLFASAPTPPLANGPSVSTDADIAPTPPADATATTDPAADDAATTVAEEIVRVDVITVPAGATVTIDGFPLPGRTPLVDLPVTARAGRVVRAELEGHDPVEERVDLLADGRVELTLSPVATEEAAAGEVAAGRVVLTVTDASWLEVYRSAARNEGERLVYTTAQPGASYEFALPVFVYVGNAAGVRVNLGGQDLGPMGAPGAVLGRAFGP